MCDDNDVRWSNGNPTGVFVNNVAARKNSWFEMKNEKKITVSIGSFK